MQRGTNHKDAECTNVMEFRKFKSLFSGQASFEIEGKINQGLNMHVLVSQVQFIIDFLDMRRTHFYSSEELAITES